jgi:signal transduction histidine kinase
MHTHDNGTEPILSAIKTPLSQASLYLSHYRSRIAAAWRRMLQRYEPCRPFLGALTGVKLTTRLKEAAAASPRVYREEAERVGRDLARDGVPAGCIALAVTLYVEGCLRYLTAEDPQTVQWRHALARWASAYQFTLLSGYAAYIAEHTKSLEERTALAERRSKDLLVEMGDAYEKERRKLAQDLHDEIGHDLIVLKLYTQVIELDLKKGQIGLLRGKLRESLSLINHALKGIRHLVFDLGPAVWNEQGFIPAVRLYTRQFANRTGLRTSFSARRLHAKLPAHYETTMYKVLQGALANVAAHAGARTVNIILTSRRDQVVLKIEDDGKGFNVGRTLKRPPRSYGLRAMRDRIELLGGTIEFISRPARRHVARGGTLVEIHLPLHEIEAS